MTVEDSNFVSCSGLFKPRKLEQTLSPYALTLVLIYRLS